MQCETFDQDNEMETVHGVEVTRTLSLPVNSQRKPNHEALSTNEWAHCLHTSSHNSNSYGAVTDEFMTTRHYHQFTSQCPKSRMNAT
jgi:hypothetical protein